MARKATQASKLKGGKKIPPPPPKRSIKEIIRDGVRDEIMDLVDSVTHPDRMPDWRDAFEFLTDLADELTCRTEVLQEEHPDESPFKDE